MKVPAIAPSWGTTVLRLVAGYVFLVHGAHDVFQSGFSGLAGTFGSLHVPLPFVSAVIVTLVEFFGGIALLLGVVTRSASALLALDMLVAVMVVLLEPGFFRPGGVELPLMMLGASIALVLSGPGALSLAGSITFARKPTPPKFRSAVKRRCLRRIHHDDLSAAPNDRAVRG